MTCRGCQERRNTIKVWYRRIRSWYIHWTWNRLARQRKDYANPTREEMRWEQQEFSRRVNI